MFNASLLWGRARWVLAVAMSLSTAVMAQADASGKSEQLEIGRRIYTEGLLSDGSKLSGMRFGNIRATGAEVACVNCHRPSGLGQVEGDITVPPIAGKFLFAIAADKQLVNMDPRVSKFFNQAHDPYTEGSLATAISNGVNSQGRTMSLAMPRYQMNAAELQALTVYLKQLSADWSPGVTNSAIRFATVITPDVAPQRRQVMKDMMQLIVRQKNGSTHPAQGGRTRHHMTSAAEMVLGTERKWELDFWELQGAADTWDAQLNDFYRRQPVFALLSGLSNGTWQPVHDFCDRERVPCWFPTVDVPGKTVSPYAFYFSGGVVTEANVLARHLLEQKPRPARVVQIYRDDEVGRAASAALNQALAGSSIAVESRILSADLPVAESLRVSVDKLKAAATLMFWLGPSDVQALGQFEPIGVKRFFSTVLGKGEHAPLTAKWRSNSFLIYPYELPEQRAPHLIYFHAWRNLRKIALVDEALQSEVFFALNFMTDTVSDMLENFYRDYLVERAEGMLSRREGGKAEQEARDRMALGRAGELEKKHGSDKVHESIRVPLQQQVTEVKSQGTTMYPHLSLAPGQRLASKGAYIVRFASGSGEALVRVSDWIVPQ
jgi:hypothetical protein